MSIKVLMRRTVGIYKPVISYDDLSAKGRKRLIAEAERSYCRVLFGRWKLDPDGNYQVAFIPNNGAEAVTQSNADPRAVYSGEGREGVSGYYWKHSIQPLSEPGR